MLYWIMKQRAKERAREDVGLRARAREGVGLRASTRGCGIKGLGFTRVLRT